MKKIVAILILISFCYTSCKKDPVTSLENTIFGQIDIDSSACVFYFEDKKSGHFQTWENYYTKKMYEYWCYDTFTYTLDYPNVYLNFGDTITKTYTFIGTDTIFWGKMKGMKYSRIK